MPIPFLLAGAAAIAGATGVVKGAKAISNNSEARDLINRAQSKYDRAQSRLEEQRDETTKCLEQLGRIKLYAWSTEMKNFLELFQSFKNVRLEGNVNVNEHLKMQLQNPNNLRNIEIATVKASEVTKAGVASLGAGALAGIASYGGAMMFASASTGTAIASLSGAAATNATLAWFGGGALSAGGLGMAGGSMVLGGIVAGPVLAVAGFIMAAKSEENLASARKTYAEAKEAVEKMDTMTDFMSSVSVIADDYSDFINSYRGKFGTILVELKNIRDRAMQRQEQMKQGRFRSMFSDRSKVDFRNLSFKEQKTLHVAWLMAQVLYSVLSAPLLTQGGDIDANAQSTLNDANQSLDGITQARKQLEQMPDEEVKCIQTSDINSYDNVQQLQTNGMGQDIYPNADNGRVVQKADTSYQGVSGNGAGWKFLHGLMFLWNWIYAICYFVGAIGLFREHVFSAALVMILMSVIICPALYPRKQISYRRRFGKKVLRFVMSILIGAIILSILFRG